MEKIVVGVCTRSRPLLLTRCLNSLQAQRRPQGAEIHILVADNDDQPGNRDNVLVCAEAGPYPAHYVHEPRRGIAQARNAIVEKSLELGADWLAFIDDDQEASPDWLEGLFNAAWRHGAEVVRGRVQFVYPTETPVWAAGETWKVKPGPEGKVLRTAATCSVIVASRVFLPTPLGLGLRFEERLGMFGMEDTDLFGRARLAGVRIIHTNNGLACEKAHASRLTLDAVLWRKYSHGVAQGVHSRIGSPAAVNRFKLFRRIMRRIAFGVLGIMVSPLTLVFGATRFLRFSLACAAELCLGLGTLAGLSGLGRGYYEELHGD